MGSIESIIVNPDIGSLCVSPGQVARYAGGAGYRLNSSMQELAVWVLAEAARLARPAFVYNIHEVTGILKEGYVEISGGSTFPLPSGEGKDPGIKYIAFCICTLGPKLEETVRKLFSKGDTLKGLFLDAAGLAFLEALSAVAYEAIHGLAKASLLRAGCRFGPGYEGMDPSFQKRLFELVEASAIGVWLNETFVMSPAKSLSFSAKWTTSKETRIGRHKCASCTLSRCLHRL